MSPFLTIQDLAERWRCSPSRIYHMRPEQLPPVFRLPGQRQMLFPLRHVEEFEARHIVRPAPAEPETMPLSRKPGRPRKPPIR